MVPFPAGNTLQERLRASLAGSDGNIETMLGGHSNPRSSGLLRIAMVAGKFPAFSETFVSEMAARLVARGHDLTIFASRKGDDTRHPEIDAGNLIARTKYRPRRSGLLRRGGVSGYFSAGLGALEHPRVLSRELFGAQAWSLRPMLAAQPWRCATPFDAVLCHFGPNAALMCRLRRAGVINAATPIVAIFHGIDVISTSDDDLQLVQSDAEAIFADSRFLRDRLIERGVGPDCVLVQRMGTDLGRFPASPIPVREPSDELRLTFVGRLIKYKAPDVLLQALAQVNQGNGARVTLAVIGEGPLRPKLEAQARALGINDVVRFLGAVPQPTVYKELTQSHALVIPSISIPGRRFEGLGLVAAEAMAVGRPVIGSDAGGIPEMVLHEQTGLLVPPGDAEALAKAIARLAAEPDLGARMAAKAQCHVRDEFDAEKSTDLLIQRIRELPGGAVARP